MSWIKENKFIAGLLAIVVIIGGALVYLGISSAGRYAAAKDSFDDSVRQMEKLAKDSLFPSDENAASKKDALGKYKTASDELASEFTVFIPEDGVKDMTPTEFTDQLRNAEKALLEKFAASETALPDDFHMGFERYFGQPPKSNASGQLSYQLKAIAWMLNEVAEIKPSAILNVYRERLPVELDQKVDLEGQVYQKMPIELAFTASAPRVRSFLGAIANSKEYFFRVNSIKLSSTKQQAPTREDAGYGSEEGGFGGAGDEAVPAAGESDEFSSGFDDADTAEDASEVAQIAKEVDTTPGEKILTQVLGNEEVSVHLSLDLLLFIAK